MNCPNCGAGANSSGVYLGGSNNRCLHCGVDYNYKTGEMSFRNINEYPLKRVARDPELLDKLIKLSL